MHSGSVHVTGVGTHQHSSVPAPFRPAARSSRAGRRLTAGTVCVATPAAEQAGPSGAFVAGQEGAARQQIFNRIAPVYDQLNDVLSLGLHRVWKRAAVKWSGAARGHAALDVCCGSGDLAFLLAEAVGTDGQVVGLDFAPEMLADAARREREQIRGQPVPAVRWVQGDALDLPFPDDSFDAATIGYGLRNVANITKALSELTRVLRPGASLAVLDFNNSDEPLVDGLQGWALENVVVPAARLYGMESEYQYLRPSIKRFPTGSELERMACSAGFGRARHFELAGGLMGCLVASNPYV